MRILYILFFSIISSTGMAALSGVAVTDLSQTVLFKNIGGKIVIKKCDAVALEIKGECRVQKKDLSVPIDQEEFKRLLFLAALSSADNNEIIRIVRQGRTDTSSLKTEVDKLRSQLQGINEKAILLETELGNENTRIVKKQRLRQQLEKNAAEKQQIENKLVELEKKYKLIEGDKKNYPKMYHGLQVAIFNLVEIAMFSEQFLLFNSEEHQGSLEYILLKSYIVNPGTNPDFKKVPSEDSEFEMQTTEVTQLEYYLIMDKNPSLKPTKKSYYDFDEGLCENYFTVNEIGLCPNNPANRVGLKDIYKFIERKNKLNDGYVYRLPTEKEWNSAAQIKGSLIENGWFWENTDGLNSKSVATITPNAFGIYDLYGNVAEVVEDKYTSWRYCNREKDNCRVILGGSIFERVQDDSFKQQRLPDDPDHVARQGTYTTASGGIGFRLVRVPATTTRQNL